MQIKLAYGEDGIDIHLNDGYDIKIIEPKFIDAFDYPQERIRESLRKPYGSLSLERLVSHRKKIGIVFSDITRPVPLKIIIPVIIDEMSEIKEENITLFNALGTHRPNTNEELRMMLGDVLVDRFRIVQNNAFDPTTQRFLGTSSIGHEIFINDELSSCDLVILTGFIEPHFFAGFSGGGKAIMPGMAGLTTILGNHDAKMIANPKSTFGVTQGNPIWEEIFEVSQMIGNPFLVNVTLNRNKQITGVFSGNVETAHHAGCNFVRTCAMVPVEDVFDIVITTNSGYPLDINLYQGVKGMSAASQIIREGGDIIIAAECRDGIPDHGCYGNLLREFNNPEELLKKIMSSDELIQDQWQAQIQAQIQMWADIHVYSDYLSNEQIESVLLKPCGKIDRKVKELIIKYGSEVRICILPEGPQTIPYLI